MERKARPVSKLMILGEGTDDENKGNDVFLILVQDLTTEAELNKAIDALEPGTYTVRRYWDRTITKQEVTKMKVSYA